MTPRQRIAERFVYARLFRAMTYEQAKGILGFPPGSRPSPEEIKKNYLKLVRENHPDRGGSTEKMRDINVAKDIVDGKQTPDVPNYGYSPPAPAPPDPPKPTTRDYYNDLDYTFEEAFKRAKIPADTYWAWVSPIYEVPAALDGFKGEAEGWVLYGRTNKYHVFVAVQFVMFRGDYDSNTSSEPMTEGMWFSDPVLFPLTKPFSSIHRKGFNEATKKFRYVGLRTMPFNPKLYIVGGGVGVRYIRDAWFLTPHGNASTADQWLEEIGEVDQRPPPKIQIKLEYPQVEVFIDGMGVTVSLSRLYEQGSYFEKDILESLKQFMGVKRFTSNIIRKDLSRSKQLPAFLKFYKNILWDKFPAEVSTRIQEYISKSQGSPFPW